MDLVAGDDRVFLLAHLADLADDGTDLVVLLHRLADGRVGGVHAVFLRQRIQHPAAHLLDVGIQRVVGDLVGDVAVGDEEIGLVVDLQDLEVLHGAVHHGTGVHAGQRVKELVAALHAAFHQGAGIFTGVVGHIIGSDVQRTGAGGAESDGEAAGQIQQRLRHVVAGIADGQLSLCLCLLDQIVVGILQQALEVDQMLQVSQELHLSPM